MDQFFHPGEDFFLGWQNRLVVGHVDRPARQFIQALMQNSHALAHFLHPHQITVVAISDGTNRNVELQLVVNQIRVDLAQIVLHTAPAQVRPGHSIINGNIFWQHPNIPRPIDENAVPRQ